MEVGSLSSEAVTVAPDLKVSKIIGLMRDKQVYEVFVEAGDKIGVVTGRSLLPVSDIANRGVSSVLTYVPKIPPSASVDEVAKRMAEFRVRSLPIIEGGRVSRQVTAAAIVDAMKTQGLGRIKAKDIMTPSPIVVAKEDLATKARSLMVQRRIDHLPVVDGRLSGMITSPMILFHLLPAEGVKKGAVGAEMQRRLAYPVERLMDTDPESCTLTDDAATIFEQMSRRQRTYSVVTLWDAPQGIITLRDFIKLLSEDESKEVPAYIIGLPDDPFEAETTKTKFSRTVATLRKTFPQIEEARSVIKTRIATSGKRRYEVRVAVKTARKNYSYTEEGWDLPSTYDAIVDKLKRLMAQKAPRRRSSRTELP